MQVEGGEQDMLVRRVERLERQNRALKAAGSLAVLAAAAVVTLGVGAPRKTLETELLLIKDANGSTRMILGMADDGPAITMLDAKGKLRANIGVTEHGPELDFLDASEIPRIQMAIDGKQAPRLNLLDHRGTQVSFRP